jgi:hypothetical protein
LLAPQYAVLNITIKCPNTSCYIFLTQNNWCLFWVQLGMKIGCSCVSRLTFHGSVKVYLSG